MCFSDDTPDTQYICWLRKIYEDTFNKILQCVENSKQSIQAQAFSTAMKIISYEGKYPLEPKGEEYYFPMQKLKVSNYLTNKNNISSCPASWATFRNPFAPTFFLS